MTSRLLAVLAVILAIAVGATAQAADRAKSLKKRPDGKSKYFKALTGGHSAKVKETALKPGNSKTVDVTEKLGKGSKKLAKKPARSKRQAIAARATNRIRQTQVIKLDAKSFRARPEARYSQERVVSLKRKNGGR